MDRRRLLLAGLGGFLAACAGTALPAASERPLSPLAAHPQRGIWPVRFHSSTLEVREAYAFAASNWPTLRYIPCYCGCGQGSGHRDNYDCYVKETRADGWLVLDTHGFG